LTNEEFDLLDNLYFIISFEELKAELGWEEIVLKNRLLELIQKDWVKCLKKGSDDLIEGTSDFEFQYKKYNYLATKEGLLAHNSK
jgi:hypothetical protein